MDGNRQYSRDVEANGYEEDGIAERMSIDQLQRLVHLVDGSDISEIEVKCADRGMHLVLRRARIQGKIGEMVNSSGVSAESTTVTSPLEKKYTVTASLVGIFHTGAKPKTSPLIHIGDRVKVGQIVGTIQSLNVINEVESLVAGRIVEVFVQDGQPVEYGQPLMSIDSSEEA